MLVALLNTIGGPSAVWRLADDYFSMVLGERVY